MIPWPSVPTGTGWPPTTPKATCALWDVVDGQPIGQPISLPAAAPEVVFSPDGHRLATNTTTDGGVRLWDAATGTTVGQPLGGGRRVGAFVTRIAFSHRSGTVAAAAVAIGSTNPVAWLQVLNTDTGEAIWTQVITTDHISSMAFSPDDNRIVTGGSDKMVRLWDARTGKPAAEPIGLHDQVSDVAFTARGSHRRRFRGYRPDLRCRSQRGVANGHRGQQGPPSRLPNVDSWSCFHNRWPTHHCP